MMLSWHKVGQKVTPIHEGEPFLDVDGSVSLRQPIDGFVYTVAQVHTRRGIVWFGLAEFPPKQLWDADDFRPVYPEIIDSLRRLEVPAGDHVREDA